MPNPPTTKRAAGRAGGASRGGPGGGAPPQEALRYANIDRTEPTDGTEHDGDRTDRTDYLPVNRRRRYTVRRRGQLGLGTRGKP
eukprot:14285009-Alexandrium_andersonii.AAC.1